MEEESTLDFNALRAKFQGNELPLKQPAPKPALPDKPKVVPSPQSPTSYIPVGARPSLLSTITQSATDGKSALAPRVVFKDDKKEMKKPLIAANSKGKDKIEGKVKGGKDKTSRESKEKIEDEPQDKQKKENGKEKKFFTGAKKEIPAELVSAAPPPKGPTPKKKGLFGFMKSTKRDSVEVTAEPILDTSTSDILGPAPLIPAPSDFGNPYSENSESILPNSPTLSESSAGVEMSPPPDFIPPPAFIPDIPAPEIPNIEFEIPHQTEDPASTDPIPSPPSYTISSPPLLAPDTSPAPAELDLAAETVIEAVSIAAVEAPPAPVIDPPQIRASPNLEHPMSALSALERAEDMSPEKKGKTVDQRILGALQKARRKTSPVTTPPNSSSITPPPEDIPSLAWLDLPPIDYDGSGGSRPPKPAEVNGIHHLLEGISEEKPDPSSDLLVVPPPPPRSLLPASEPLIPAEEPASLPSANLTEFIPPPLVHGNGVAFPSALSEMDTTDNNVASGVQSPELPDSQQWRQEDYTNEHEVYSANLPQIHSNGIGLPEADMKAEPVFEDHYHKIIPNAAAVSGNPDVNGTYENIENAYEDAGASASKKKTKSDNSKKRKGPPKNPYAEPGQETNQEKSKTGKFGKAEKKASGEGVEEKESKKKEKQRLEKEKKELKEKQEKEKKEQKEKEKKESEQKKKFKITGQEDAIYQAKVTMTTKGRKNDLPVKDGEIVSVIRTTNCPKGKWLARDSSNNYGYVAVDHVELDIKEMLELGKKARKTNNNVTEPDSSNTGNTVSNHDPLSGESFEEDSEEWTADDEEPVSPAADTADPSALISHTRAVSAPEMVNQDLSINHQHSQSSDISADGSQSQAKHEALQKLATFFRPQKAAEAAARTPEKETSPLHTAEEAVHTPKPSTTQGIEFDDPNMIILPPPDLYA